MTDLPRKPRAPKVPTDEQLLARKQYEQYIRQKMSRMGLGPKHQLQKRIVRMIAQSRKWEHSDPQYGQKLAIAMCRIADLKRDSNLDDNGQRLDGN